MTSKPSQPKNAAAGAAVPNAPALWQQLDAVAKALHGILGGQSSKAVLAQVPQRLRPGVQALLFQVLRNLGRAQALQKQEQGLERPVHQGRRQEQPLSRPCGFGFNQTHQQAVLGGPCLGHGAEGRAVAQAQARGQGVQLPGLHALAKIFGAKVTSYQYTNTKSDDKS